MTLDELLELFALAWTMGDGEAPDPMEYAPGLLHQVFNVREEDR